jgi:[acyl-carrier-protein] S-malonyltransferase
MGQALWRLPPARQVMDRLSPLLGDDLFELMTRSDDAELICNRNVHRIVHAHHLGNWFAFQALHGEAVGGVISMSSGTAAALVASGAMSIEDSCAYVRARTAAFEAVCAELKGRYGSVIVIGERSFNHAPLLQRVPGLSVAFRVAPWKTVVAGTHADIAALRKIALEDRAPVQINDVAVEAPYHTPAFSSCKPAIAACVADLEVRAPRIPLFLGASGRRESDPARLKTYLVESADHGEPYCDALQAAYDFGLREFLEVGHDPKTERYVADRLLTPSGTIAGDVVCRGIKTEELPAAAARS